MKEHLAKFKAEEGVLFVGKAQEKTPVIRTQRRRDAKTGQPYPWLVKSTAMVNHFYFYAVDRDFGPFFLLRDLRHERRWQWPDEPHQQLGERRDSRMVVEVVGSDGADDDRQALRRVRAAVRDRLGGHDAGAQAPALLGVSCSSSAPFRSRARAPRRPLQGSSRPLVLG